MEEQQSHPRLFISYSHEDNDNGAHAGWVLKLATDLRHHGVDVILDQWDLRLGDDLPFFMEQGLSDSSMVLCICSTKYVTKANAGKGGVGYEKKILASNLINDATVNFIIPIMRNTEDKKLPFFLSGSTYVDFTGDDYYGPYSKLIKRIYGEDVKEKPALGQNPFIRAENFDKISSVLNLQSVEFHNPNMSGRVTFNYLRNNGCFKIGQGDYLFETLWSGCGNGVVHCYCDRMRRIGYNPTIEDIPSFEKINADNFDFTSRVWPIYEGQVAILENQNGKFAAIKVLKVSRPCHGKGAVLDFEYLIYTII